jgi:hypothetical protein
MITVLIVTVACAVFPEFVFQPKYYAVWKWFAASAIIETIFFLRKVQQSYRSKP